MVTIRPAKRRCCVRACTPTRATASAVIASRSWESRTRAPPRASKEGSRGAKKLQQCRPSLEKINSFLSSLGEAQTTEKLSLADVLRRPSVSLRMLAEKGVVSLPFSGFSAEQQEDLLDELETSIKYEGYIKRQDSLIKRLAQNESAQIPPTFNFNACPALSSEARDKLSFVQPETLGQASRVEQN